MVAYQLTGFTFSGLNVINNISVDTHIIRRRHQNLFLHGSGNRFDDSLPQDVLTNGRTGASSRR